MARLRYNGLTATLGADLLTADTTITFSSALTSAAGAVPTITGSDYIPLAVIDASGGVLEIIHLTAYTEGATTGTVTRAQESTTAADHAAGLTIVNGLTVADTTEFGGGGVTATKFTASGAYSVTGTEALVPGLTHTLTAAGNYLVITNLDYEVATGDTFAYARLKVNGAAAGTSGFAKGAGTHAVRSAISVTYHVAAAVAGDVLEVTAARTGSGATKIYDSSTLLVVRL